MNSDDGFVVSTGPSLKDHESVVLGSYEGARGAADTLFDILVEEDGIYPIRLLWYQGGGGANVEFFSVTDDGEKVLINDPSHAEAIKAYRTGTTRPFISAFSPQGRTLTDTLEYTVNNADINVVESSIQLTLDGTDVTPEVTSNGGVITVNYTNPDGFFLAGDHLAILTYDESSDPVVTRTFRNEFSIANGQSTVLLDNPFLYWRLGETEGDSANNEISSAHTGGYTNNPGLGAERLVVGDSSSAVLFDASQQHWIALANHADINDQAVNSGWTEKTVEFWFKARNLPNSDPVLEGQPISQRQVIYEQGGATRGVNVYLVGTQDGPNPTEAELWFNILNRAETAWGGTVPFNEDQGLSPNDEAIAVGTAIQANTLYHAVLVFQGDAEDGGLEGGITGYLNGEPFGEATGAHILFDHTDGIAIGRRNSEVSFHDMIINAGGAPDIFNSSEQFYYDGWLDEFALYNVALTAEQVKAHYDAGLVEVPADIVEPPTPPISGGGMILIIRDTSDIISIIYSGTLKSAATIDGPFEAIAGAISPFIVASDQESRFYIAD
ncbi:MAG: hypothetical protein M2R45_03040 [Verrucomicrobia subdivision 3 bacterium]|nr:hypothetical protein [Limisphaerales bacterium]MCS1415560.1 hypothetical protein [Limisphaerales bacterium]